MGINWTNERRKLRDLQPWERNPRTIKDRNAKILGKSFEDFGQVETLAIGPNAEVYNGHQRLSVLAGQHGLDYEVDVRVASRELSEKERERLTVYLHRGAAGDWDWSALAEWDYSELTEWGFDSEELDAWFADAGPENAGADTEPQIDKAEELREKWQVQAGQIWALGAHRLICGDCTDEATVERLMDGERAALCVTDPPYGANYDPRWRIGVGAGGKQNYARGEFIENDNGLWWVKVFEHIPADVIYSWTADKAIVQLVADLQGYGFVLLYLIIWNKDTAVFGRGDYHYKYEPCLYMAREGKRHNWQGDRKQETVWDIPTIHSFANGATAKEWGLVGHGNQKPLECMARPVRNNSAPNEIVIDPFVGSGTTILACENLNRKCRAVEISPAYVAVCLQRWADHTGKEPILLDS